MQIMKNRISYIDIAKGIGIFLVIWGHIILSGPAYNIIYAFHMPLFFFLSGFVFSKNKYHNIKEFFIKKVKTLIIPYIFLSLITYAYWVLIENRFNGNNTNVLKPFIQIFIAQGSGGYMQHNIPMWFVPCLFIVENIGFFISKIKKNYLRIVITVFLGILGCIITTTENNIFNFKELFWSIEIALVAIPFYNVGVEVTNKISKEKLENIVINNKKISVIICIITIMILFITANINGHISMGSDELGNCFLFYLNAFLGIVGTITISIFIIQNKILEFMGRKSFFIMATHFPVRKPIILLFSKILIVESSVIYNSIFYSFIIAIITLVVEIIIIKILEKIKPISKYLCLQN